MNHSIYSADRTTHLKIVVVALVAGILIAGFSISAHNTSDEGLTQTASTRVMRVLLIEDDSAVAQSIELMLKSESFNVYTTDLGEEGVDLGKLYDYDIILLDLNLPDMDKKSDKDFGKRRPV